MPVSIAHQLWGFTALQPSVDYLQLDGDRSGRSGLNRYENGRTVSHAADTRHRPALRLRPRRALSSERWSKYTKWYCSHTFFPLQPAWLRNSYVRYCISFTHTPLTNQLQEIALDSFKLYIRGGTPPVFFLIYSEE